jgi:hypothetical protein
VKIEVSTSSTLFIIRHWRITVKAVFLKQAGVLRKVRNVTSGRTVEETERKIRQAIELTARGAARTARVSAPFQFTQQATDDLDAI